MDNLNKEQRKKNMQHIRSKNTIPEKMIAKELRKRKIYFVQNDERVFGKPDFVFRRKKVVVFIDSDFWHVNPERFIMPKSNIEYWTQKIERNKRRDIEVNIRLLHEGWRVIRLWEYDVKKSFEESINIIYKAIGKE